MTVYATIHEFFNSFGIPAYPDTDMTARPFPYMTYSVPLSHFDEGETAGTVNLWYKTESEAIPNAKAAELSDAIGRGCKELKCDDGVIYLKRGSPWCQPLNDESDTSIKRRLINITFEFCT